MSPINAGRAGRPSKPLAHHRARVAALSRDRAPDDPELLAAKRDLAAANIEKYIRDTLAAAPELTAEQRSQLAALLAPVRIKPTAPRIHKRGKRSHGGAA